MSSSKSSKGLGAAIGIVVVVAVLAAVVFAAKGYFQDRYTGDIYYARVPVEEQVQVTDLLDDKGQPAARGYEYSLTGYSEAGDSLPLEFAVYSDNVADLYAPGTYIRAEANPQIVVSQSAISEDEVPAWALEKLQ